MTVVIRNIMVDLETWGTCPGSDIRSIGAVEFNPTTGEFGDEFYRNVVGGTDYGLVHDPKTVKWWDDQSEAARNRLGIDQRMLSDGLQEFADWWKGRDPDPKGEYTRFWAHGPHFDEAILGAAFRAVGIDVPWSHRAPRDMRTVFDTLGWVDLPFEGVEHNALDDTKHQARCVIASHANHRKAMSFASETVRDLLRSYSVEIKELRDRRDDLLNANNREVERRRGAENLLREAAGMFRMYERHHRQRDSIDSRNKAERNAFAAERIESFLDGRLIPGVDLVALIAAGRDLYFAGRWSCDREVEEARLWTVFRDALGLPPGSATALQIGVAA